MENYASANNRYKIAEAMANYSLSDNLTQKNEQSALLEEDFFYTEDEFWYAVLYHKEHFWNKKISLKRFVLSSWIPRVPGLYWTDTSVHLREDTADEIAFKSKHYIEYKPVGKSRKVLGGVGTIKLAPQGDGTTAFSVTSSCNSSLGIPVVIRPEVIDELKLREGDVISISQAKWLPCSQEWSKSFPLTMGIPRGILNVDDARMITVHFSDAPVLYHPFSIMEYETDNTYLYDFVYCSVDNKVKNANKCIADFFSKYSSKEGRNGRYLINPNMVTPLFDAIYLSPSEMNSQTERTNIDLLYKRVKRVNLSGHDLSLLLDRLPSKYDSVTSLRTLAVKLGVNPALLIDGSAAAVSAGLINQCIDKGKGELLVEHLMNDYPLIFE